MFAHILNLEAENSIVTTFRTGTHEVGRGPTLQCNDNRVSRNHAIIEITQEAVKLTSTHINPCFLKIAASKTITLLSKGSSFKLNDGDAFGFLPDIHWFRVRIGQETVDYMKTEEACKRFLNDAEENLPDKRAKLEQESDFDEPEHDAAGDAISINAINSTKATFENMQPEQVFNGNTNQTEATSHHTMQNNTPRELEESLTNEFLQKEEVTSNQDIKVEANNEQNFGKTNDNTDPCSSTQLNNEENSGEPDNRATLSLSVTTLLRERCWYGAECYRRNELHRNHFKHPGDSDYESDPGDNRPMCSYGSACYRKNSDHRRNFKHPLKPSPNEATKKRSRKKVNHNDTAYDEDLEDLWESESEDPFLTDGDSDEYVQGSDTDDSEWEDSQNVDEESENTRVLVKEANKFMKK